MKTVCILGDGELSQMLRRAGETLGIKVYSFGETGCNRNTVVTAVAEHWSDINTASTKQGNFINGDIYPQLADRLSQKQLFDKLKIPTPAWQLLEKPQQWATIFKNLGKQVVVKRRIGTFNTYKPTIIKPGKEKSVKDDEYGHRIVEKYIDFQREVSLIGARSHNGDCVFYPMTYNFYSQKGTLQSSVAFPYVATHLQTQAETMLTKIMQQLNYIGVMTMEGFVVGDKLLINEIAPRVHNSGLWTKNGASINQFELHLRAILDLPLPKPSVSGPAASINLINIKFNPQWLDESQVHLYWYGKENFEGKRVGHINLAHPVYQSLQHPLNHLISLLPEDYQPPLIWLKRNLV